MMIDTIYIIAIVGFVLLSGALALLYVERLRNKNLIDFFSKKLEAKQLVIDTQDELLSNREEAIKTITASLHNQNLCLEELKNYFATTNLTKAEKTNILLAINAAVIKEEK